VVELMAAGVVPIAHDSGGPRADIVVPFHGHTTGHLAATEGQYADALAAVFTAPRAEVLATAAAGRACVARFSDEEFLLSFYAGVAGLLRAGLGDLRARRAAAVAAGGGGGGGGASSGATSGGERKRW
jgi:alpha-1,2-mannosyltransferase